MWGDRIFELHRRYRDALFRLSQHLQHLLRLRRLRHAALCVLHLRMHGKDIDART